MTARKDRIPHDKCHALTRSGRNCQRPSGWGTDHVGSGKCKLHGGKTPIKSGRYSSIEREGWKERVERFRALPDPLDLSTEVAQLRAFVEDLIERWESIYGPDGALLAWHESFKTHEYGHPKPRQMPDFSAISTVVDRVGAMVDRIQKHKAEGSISLLTLNRIVEQFGAELVGAVQEVQIDADTSSRLLETVERRWKSIRVESGRSGNSRD